MVCGSTNEQQQNRHSLESFIGGAGKAGSGKNFVTKGREYLEDSSEIALKVIH